MSEDIDHDIEDAIDEQATKEVVEKGKKERRMYKGEVLTVEAVMAKLGAGVIPVQPVKRKFTSGGFSQALPPTFLVTKFAHGYNGAVQMHYYQPKAQQKLYRDVPKNFELNVLSGLRAQELMDEWEKAMDTQFGYVYRRLTCTIGTDPEIFVVDEHGKVIPAWTFVKSKEKAAKYKTAEEGGFSGHYYWDGFQGEFTTAAGLSCLAQMTDCVQSGLKSLYNAAREKNKKATLSIKSVVQVEDKVLAEASPEHVAFGCAPSKNAYGLTGNLRDGREVPYRFAGGHIHIGLPGQRPEYLKGMVKALDAILGVACVSMYANMDNPIRRQFYGLPGEYRLPSHGVEYRTLSNAWLCHPLMTHMTFDLARAAAGIYAEGMMGMWKADESEVIDTIINHNVERARTILKRNEKALVRVLQTINGSYLTKAHSERAAEIWHRGVEEAIKDPEDLVGNWHLDSAWGSHSGDSYFAGRIGTLLKGKKV